MASSDFILEIEGIDGESEDHKFKGKIDIESFSWGCMQPGSHAGGGGGGAGKATFNDFMFTKKVSKASPLLFIKCAGGDHIKKAVLHVRKAGGKQEEYYTCTLEDLLISSFNTGGSNGSPDILESVGINYTKVTFDYKIQKGDGTVAAGPKHGWDMKANKKI